MPSTSSQARTPKELFGVHYMPFVALAATSADQSVLLLDVDGRMIFSSDDIPGAKLWTSAHTEGAHLRLLYPEGGAEDGTSEAHLEIATAAGAYAGTGTRLRADGSRFAAAISILSIRDDAGTLLGFAHLMRDNTPESEQHADFIRQREEQIRHLSDARLRLVMEGITDYGIITLNNEGRILTMNTAAERATGYPREEAFGQHFSLLYLATDRDEAEREIREARERGRAAREGWRRRKDGSLYWDEEVMTALQSGDLPVEFVKITHDATDRHHATQALRAAEERFRLALRATSEVIFDHDFLADVTIWGDALLPVFGYEDVSFKVGRAWWFERVHPDERDAVRAEFAAADASGADVWTGAYRFRRADGEYAQIRSRAYLARDAAGQTIRLVGSMADVTREERAERELRVAKERAEAANRAKSDFLAVMSHELRTPLHAVIGFANILRRKAAAQLEPAHAKAVERIRENGINLLSLIDGILHLAKVESGKLDMDCRPVALGLLLRQTADQLSSTGVVPIVVDVPEGPMAALDTDEGMLRQVLVNLIGNALRFTTSGQVTLRAVVDPESRRPVRIEVVDTGPGIPEDRQAAVFEVFEQADNSSTRAHGGTGMGLAISRALCHALGYRLELASEVGRGSTFSIVLDGPKGEPRPVSPASAERPGRRE